jgi:hypothetical protein
MRSGIHRRAFTGLCAFALMLACGTASVVTPPSLCGVRGTVVDTLNRPLSGAFVELEGTNASVRADTLGHFTILNIPEGIYVLKVYLTTLYLRINSNEIMDCGRIVALQDNPWPRYSSCDFTIDRLRCWDRLGDSVFRDRDMEMYYSVHLTFGQFSLSGQVLRDGLPAEARVRIIGAAGVLYDSIPVKGRLNTPVLTLQTRDQIMIEVDSCAFGPYSLITDRDPTLLQFAYLSLADTMKKRSPGTYSLLILSPNGHNQITPAYYVAGPDTFFIFERESSYCVQDHFEVNLVNDATGDTCSERNTNPDWGVAGDSIDNPFLIDNDVGLCRSGHTPEGIMITRLPAGVYHVLVRYIDGSDSSAKAPVLTILLGPVLPYHFSDQSVGFAATFVAPRVLRRGETWYVGSLRSPVMAIDTTGQNIKME